VAAVVIAAIGFGWFGGMSEEPKAVSDDALVQTSPVEPSARMGAAAPSAERHSPQTVSASDPLLAWDDADAIRNLYRRMESMQPTGLLDWGERSIPLETLPGAAPGGLQPPGAAGIQQARSERPPN
jgi:hypothetical protein